MNGLVDASESMLVVVDLQDGWFSERLSGGSRKRLYERAALITATAGELNIPIVITEEDPAKNGRTAGAVTELLHEKVDPFEKSTFDAASDVAIRSAIEAQGRNTVVLIGMETDVCIAQSATGLTSHGFRVLVVSDAVAAPEEHHREGLERMRGQGIELIGSKALYYEWTRTVEVARAVRQRLTLMNVLGEWI